MNQSYKIKTVLKMEKIVINYFILDYIDFQIPLEIKKNIWACTQNTGGNKIWVNPIKSKLSWKCLN